MIGGSAGALEAVRTIFSQLARDLPVSAFVAIHTAPDAVGALDLILSRPGQMPAHYAVDRESILHGRVYLAPPDHHLIVKSNHVRLTKGPRENGFRPALDPLFRTAAANHGPRVIGVLLSGGQDDGVIGLQRVKQQGGVVIVQEPSEALVSNMPLAAIRNVAVDHVVKTSDIAGMVSELIAERVSLEGANMARPREEDVAEQGAHDIHRTDKLGPPSPFTCPDCGGTLWQSEEGELLQFRCHIGHRYSGDALAGAQSDSVDQALWTALRALEEYAELHERMARRARERGMSAVARAYSQNAREGERRAMLIRRVLMPEALTPELDGA